ncbi:GNAT family N-acetyltransferase [Nocardioides sp. URHA0020]|uniref:GNAT family N-acetyltransferase n=1 Tax=Nocardioides sp. URHA0020 TaxID=1380392 RepID=UPI0012DD18F4|nr:GNAT family N-acetyltransferase [Nocardioides sp. URHA0020]
MTLVESSALTRAEREAVRAIYEGAFPDELQVPFDDLFVDRMLVLLDEDGPAGFALVRDLSGTPWTFLRYYAVGRRGRGTGSAMWRLLTDVLAREGRTRLVWDVEDPDEVGLSPDLVEEHRRRIVFYERLGGRLQPVRDYLPPHDDGHAPQLLLMDAPLADVPDPSLRELVETVYLRRYGVRADHPVVRRTLRASSL